MSFIVKSVRSLESSVGDAGLQNGSIQARQLGPQERIDLALQALRRSRPITDLAGERGVSRKFIYRQLDRAQTAVEEAFQPCQAIPKLVGWLPVTANWIEQVVLSASLECHGSIRGICAHVESITGFSISEGKVCAILANAIVRAIDINVGHDLSAITTGAHDEIFSQGTPVLVGVDPRSFYTYLMEPSPSRDEVAWGVALLEKAQRQGLSPSTSVADAARGMRAGVQAAFPGIDIQGDVFHAQTEVSELVFYLERRAYAKLRHLEQEEKKMDRAKGRSQGHHRSKTLALARKKADEAIHLYDDFRALAVWLVETLELIGPDLETRRWAYDFVVAQMRARACGSHRIGPVVTYLTQQRDDLLAFVPKIQEGLHQIARRQGVSRQTVQIVYRQQGLCSGDPLYWELQGQILHQAGPKASKLQEEVQQLLQKIVRASSAVENINSILRTYFFLRKTVGVEFLELLRFYLNHRRFRRSARPERVGRSPYEILTGQTHAHWLKLLGYTPVSLRQ